MQRLDLGVIHPLGRLLGATDCFLSLNGVLLEAHRLPLGVSMQTWGQSDDRHKTLYKMALCSETDAGILPNWHHESWHERPSRTRQERNFLLEIGAGARYITCEPFANGGTKEKKMHQRANSCWLALSMVLAPVASFAAVPYSEDFNVDNTAGWTVNDPALSDVTAEFFYDYSAIGVPAAPNGTGTRGLKLTANNSGGVFSGFSVSPNGQSFTGDYRVEFDMWQNYVGPLGAGGSGSTQLTLYGIGTSGTTGIWAGSSPKESVAFGTTLDGGSAADYRAYSSAAATSYADGDPVYFAPSRNNSHAYYAGFTAQSAPAAQVALFPGQTLSTDVGETSFAWRRVVIDVSGGFATWSIDGLALARVDLSTVTLGGSNIFFGHGDTNATSSADVNDLLLNVTLIDNISVVPEPAGAVFVSALAMLALRRRGN
jgi:hypothetical protein